MPAKVSLIASRGWPACATIALVLAALLLREQDPSATAAEAVAAPVIDSHQDFDAARVFPEELLKPAVLAADWLLNFQVAPPLPSPAELRQQLEEQLRPFMPQPPALPLLQAVERAPILPTDIIARPDAAKAVVPTQGPAADALPPARVMRENTRAAGARLVVMTEPLVRVDERFLAQRRIPQGFPAVAEVPKAPPPSQELNASLRIPALARSDKAVVISRPELVAEKVIEEERSNSAPPQLAALPEPGDTFAPQGADLATRLKPEAPVAPAERLSDPEIPPEVVLAEARSDAFGPALTHVALRLEPAVWSEGEKMVVPETGPALLRAELSNVEPARNDEPVLTTSGLAPSERAKDQSRPGEMQLTIVSKNHFRGMRKSPAELLGLTEDTRPAAQKCLATAIYFESRGEPITGQIAVAQVVLNRAFSGFYPRDICGVVYQNRDKFLSCQFTFACDGKADAVRDYDSWGRADRIARDMLDGRLWIEDVAKSTHYHANWVAPGWTNVMRVKVEIGVHTFYRPRAWGDGARAPGWGEDNLSALTPVSAPIPW